VYQQPTLRLCGTPSGPEAQPLTGTVAAVSVGGVPLLDLASRFHRTVRPASDRKREKVLLTGKLDGQVGTAR
jgi:hypothetical protein